MTADPVFRFIGQGHKWVDNDDHVARVGEKVADRSDTEYGQWLSEFYKFVASSKQPRYDLVTAQLRHAIAGDRSDSPRRTVRYERLLLPWDTSSNEVFVTSCSAIVDSSIPSTGKAAPTALSGSPRPWHEVLEVSATAAMVQVQAAYRGKIAQYHPDKVAGLGPEFRVVAEKFSEEINRAYAEARKPRPK